MGNPKPPGVHAGHEGWYKNCRHPDCAAHRERYRKRWNYDRSHGQTLVADTTPARLHLATLQGAGWSLRSIAAHAGVAVTTVHKIAGGQPTARHAVIAAIRSVDPHQVPSKASDQTGEPFVPRTGTQRRIRALIFMGWPHAVLSERSGVKTATLLNQQGRWVTRSTHDKIARLYREISHQQGPSTRSHARAVKLGYVGPTAWDDIDLDAEPELEDLEATA